MNRKYRLYQEEKCLGESGLTQIGPLEVYKGDELVASFDQYLVVPSLQTDFNDSVLCWNPDGTKVGFRALKYPAGTLPDFESYIDELDYESVVCVLDLNTKEMTEIAVKNHLLELKWNGEQLSI